MKAKTKLSARETYLRALNDEPHRFVLVESDDTYEILGARPSVKKQHDDKPEDDDA
jgi:hypothetical protein